MDEEEDDFYDPVDAVPTTQSPNHAQNAAPGQAQDSNYMEDEEEVEEEEEDDVRTALAPPSDSFFADYICRMTSILSQKHPKAHQLPKCELAAIALPVLLLIFLALTHAMQAYDKNHNGRPLQTRPG
jgi:hypothetical protein